MKKCILNSALFIFCTFAILAESPDCRAASPTVAECFQKSLDTLKTEHGRPSYEDFLKRMDNAEHYVTALYKKAGYIKSFGPSLQVHEMGEMNLGIYRVETQDGTAVLKSDLGNALDYKHTIVIQEYLGELGLAAKVKAVLPTPEIKEAFSHHQILSRYEIESGHRENHGYGIVMEEVDGAWNFLKSGRVPPEAVHWNVENIVSQIRAMERAFNELRITPRDIQIAISKDGQAKLIDLTDFAFTTKDGRVFDHWNDDRRATNFRPVNLSGIIQRLRDLVHQGPGLHDYPYYRY